MTSSSFCQYFYAWILSYLCTFYVLLMYSVLCIINVQRLCHILCTSYVKRLWLIFRKGRYINAYYYYTHTHTCAHACTHTNTHTQRTHSASRSILLYLIVEVVIFFMIYRIQKYMANIPKTNAIGIIATVSQKYLIYSSSSSSWTGGLTEKEGAYNNYISNALLGDG